MSIRTTIAVAAVIAAGLATPAAAAECTTVNIDGEHATLESYGGVNWAIVGQFLWLQWDHADKPTSDGADTLSFDVSDPDVESVVACADGSVTINHTPAPASDIGTPLAAYCDIYPDTLERYCLLPNKLMVVS